VFRSGKRSANYSAECWNNVITIIRNGITKKDGIEIVGEVFDG
jgi:hypothetical protein